ncbi:MAG: dienelactone hydrolase family protein [Desulfobacterales bacterium]|jgi:dienelactone hydrolase
MAVTNTFYIKIVFFIGKAMSCICIIAGFFLTFSGCMVAETNNKPIKSLNGGETGEIHFESSNPYSYNHILDGADNDENVTVFGILKIPGATTDKVGAIVFVHGSGGWRKSYDRWVKTFNKMGIATFRLSCFKPRGISRTVGSQTRVTSSMMTADAYNALKLLSTHPRIDKDRIGIMGWSKGGAVSMISAWEPVRKAIVNSNLKFALHIALYPFCYGFESVQMTGAPILILVGEKDDWTHAEPCMECAKALKDAGYDADIIVYPDAYHAFDSYNEVTFLENALNMEKCRAIIKSNGLAIEKTSGFSMDNPEKLQKVWEICATKGVHYGKNDSAKKKSTEDVKRFIKKVFGQ